MQKLWRGLGPKRRVIVWFMILACVYLLGRLDRLAHDRLDLPPASVADGRLTIGTHDPSHRLVLKLYPGSNSYSYGEARGWFQPHVVTLGYAADAPPDRVVAFYRQELASRQPEVTVTDTKTQFTWREGRGGFVLTVRPGIGLRGTSVEVDFRGW